MIFCLMLLQVSAMAAAFSSPPVKNKGQLKYDDESKPLVYPSAVAYDSVLEEIYVVNGGSSRIVVYGPDYFPRISIGSGRGVFSPTAVAVMDNGEVYVCQVRTRRNPAARITILNAAFFVDREIFLDQIPEANKFIPKHVAVSSEGFIYLVGENSRGVMVLDSEGIFLRWIKPIDKIYARNLPKKDPPIKDNQGGGKQTDEAVDTSVEEENPFADIPEEFRPRISQGTDAYSGSDKVDGPVVVNFLTLDSTGKIYMVSNETGKVYVYGPDEDFLFSFGDKGGSPGQMSQPRALAIDEKQELIYVADYMRHTVLVFKLDGEYLFEIGGRGLEPGWYNFPTAMSINKRGQIIVADLFNGRVQVLEMAYKEWLQQYELEPDPETVSDEDSVIVIDEGTSEQSSLSPGRPEGESESQSGLEIGLQLPSEKPLEIEEEVLEIEISPEKPVEIKPPEANPGSSSVIPGDGGTEGGTKHLSANINPQPETSTNPPNSGTGQKSDSESGEREVSESTSADQMMTLLEGAAFSQQLAGRESIDRFSLGSPPTADLTEAELLRRVSKC
ncbi:MAG: NHL repeat-containing protein [Desulfuromusa sp.]|nr:NHL repeat-containing protein [Desulfuromusa sp.]